MRAALLFLACAACESATAASPEPEPEPAMVLVAQADHLLLGWQPNYDRPLMDTDDARERAGELYKRACALGDHRSCWRSPSQDHVFDNCRAGDITSCRVYSNLSPTVRAFADIAGAAARNYAWGPRKSVPTAELRRECELGLTQSCLFDLEREPDAPDASAIRARALALATEGCRTGLLVDCSALRDVGTPEAAAADAIGQCMWTGWCTAAADIAQRRGDKLRARDLRERGCQLTSLAFDCADLATFYLRGELPEPVPGRGKQLLAWACARLDYDPGRQREYRCPEADLVAREALASAIEGAASSQTP